MSISKKSESIVQDSEKISSLFACENQRILLWSDNQDPINFFLRKEFKEKSILFFLNPEVDHISNKVSRAVKVTGWPDLSIKFNMIPLPFDFIYLDRVDLWNLNKSKRDVGRLRKPILLSMIPRILRGTNVVVSSMGFDVGLSKCCHQSLEI